MQLSPDEIGNLTLYQAKMLVAKDEELGGVRKMSLEEMQVYQLQKQEP